MTQKKRNIHKRTQKSRKTSKRVAKRVSFSKKKRGGCGCGKIAGGSVFLPQLGGQYYYQLNNHEQDPNNPIAIQSGRLSGDFSGTVGGGRRKSKLRKMKGGNTFSNAYSFLSDSASNMNVIGSGQTASFNNNIITSGDTTQQPVLLNPYGGSNPPLV